MALSTGAVMAQNTRSSPPATMPSSAGAPTQPHPPAVNPLTQADVSKIEGAKVYGGDNASIGHVSEVLMDPQTRKIDRLVVSVGGVLGVGSHYVALPIAKFSWDSTAGAFKISDSMASLKALPEWHESNSVASGG